MSLAQALKEFTNALNFAQSLSPKRPSFNPATKYSLADRKNYEEFIPVIANNESSFSNACNRLSKFIFSEDNQLLETIITLATGVLRQPDSIEHYEALIVAMESFRIRMATYANEGGLTRIDPTQVALSILCFITGTLLALSGAAFLATAILVGTSSAMKFLLSALIIGIPTVAILKGVNTLCEAKETCTPENLNEQLAEINGFVEELQALLPKNNAANKSPATLYPQQLQFFVPVLPFNYPVQPSAPASDPIAVSRSGIFNIIS